jgi:hypothetical protein
MVELGSIIAKLPDHDQERLLKLLRIPGVSWRLLERG